MTKEYLQDDGQLRVFIVPVDILDVPNLTSSEKLVYVVLRSYVNPTDPTAFPAYQTIADKASLSRRRVIDIIKSLEEKGLIRKEARFTVTKERKIRDTSNTYTLITPKKATPSETISPGGVKPFHPGGETISPYHNHLTKPSINMIDCLSASAEIAAAHAEDSAALESEQDEIYDALQRYASTNCYVDHNIPMGNEYIAETYLMLVNQFNTQLSPEVVRIACSLYFERACTLHLSDGVLMRQRIENPVGFFQWCYKDAIKKYKASRNKPNRVASSRA